MNTSQWDNARGLPCRTCGVEVLRLLDGQCIPCSRNQAIIEEAELEELGRQANARLALRKLVEEAGLEKGRAALLKATCWRCSQEAALAMFRPAAGKAIGKVVCNGCGTYWV